MLRIICIFCLLLIISPAYGELRVLEKRDLHLRQGGPREWAEFNEKPDAEQLVISFDAESNPTVRTILLRQQDVKQNWTVSLNEKKLGQLVRDENHMDVHFPVPIGALKKGKNVLRISQATGRRAAVDDVRVGNVRLDSRTPERALGEGSLTFSVRDLTSNQSTPCRVTIVNAAGALQSLATKSNHHLAIRPGVVYSSNGQGRVSLPAGRYTIYSGRGFEYSVAKSTVTVTMGENTQVEAGIRREVPTQGYVACDTHVHTLTHSGHGDATVEERMITLAGEGIELPIATDHNVQIDHRPFARKLKVSAHFTPVIGNEVTTPTAHFNVFPIAPGVRAPDHRSNDWAKTFAAIDSTPGAKVTILNHARDVHSGVRPFGPKLFNDSAGQTITPRPMRFNSMEVINSGATQTDALQLLRDWMALLNRGYEVTPVGSSDSHDVARHFVGQGRTYIRAQDDKPGKIDVEQAVNNFLQGRVMVSYGLLAEIKVNDRYGSGELARLSPGKVRVGVRVLGPHWCEASDVTLYANGIKIKHAAIGSGKARDLPSGVKWQGSWLLDRPSHDVHLVAIATGPGVKGLFWPTAKAYQPASPHWESRTLGCSGAVWLDVDGDGRRTPARRYAEKIWQTSTGDLARLVKELDAYDEAVAIQVANLCLEHGRRMETSAAKAILETGSASTRAGFRSFLNAHRKSVRARFEKK